MPGESTASQALDALKNNPLFADVTEDGISSFHNINWQWDVLLNDGTTRTWYGTAYVDPNNTIYRISLRFPDTELSEFIESFGQPSHILAIQVPAPDIGGPTTWSVRVLWLAQGLEIHTDGMPPVPAIGEDLIFTEASYFQASAEGYSKFDPRHFDLMKSWQGYGDFQMYAFLPGAP